MTIREKIEQEFDDRFHNLGRFIPAYWEKYDDEHDRAVRAEWIDETDNVKTFIDETIMKLIDTISTKGVFPERNEYDYGYNQKCRELSDWLLEVKN